MIKILFICHGNICRSPMAEFIFKSIVKKAGREKDFVIASAATSSEEIWGGLGNPVYPPAKAELLKHGITCEGKRAVQLQKTDYRKYDLLIGMDTVNIKNILRTVGGDPDGKVHKLMSFAGRDDDVADPWYSEQFDVAYADIKTGCAALWHQLCEKDFDLANR
ncbi:MAG: low molecular weight phosphotyrosine protein phosphatase [Clostridia bacterium]|nr:low molecular weight phosphotyrosine protein phosphatase [Clostridia bacterium]